LAATALKSAAVQSSFVSPYVHHRAIERGVDAKVIAEWQGHKDGGKQAHSRHLQPRLTARIRIEWRS
jgi:hypothetical protein